jgi:bifunctional DNA-binding transcriptional regulator/antitoxin component of YhaV-PrlF toxin-antitoxin module
VVGKVGLNGELRPPKKLLIEAGLTEGTEVIFHVIQGRLIVERLKSLEELINKPSKVIVTIEELRENRQQLSNDAEKL